VGFFYKTKLNYFLAGCPFVDFPLDSVLAGAVFAGSDFAGVAAGVGVTVPEVGAASSSTVPEIFNVSFACLALEETLTVLVNGPTRLIS
jgi:hypothetical protein